MFFIFSRKKRKELDDARSKEVERMKSDTFKVIDNATRKVEQVNEEVTVKIGVEDLAKKLFYATRRDS